MDNRRYRETWISVGVIVVVLGLTWWQPARAEDELGNMVFFRGGYVYMFSDQAK
jgi:hypothetical protein